MGDESTIISEVVNREGKYLTFSLGQEEYGIGILKIKEIIGMMPITPVPQTPDFVQGVVNLRGKVIPVVDLRRRFSMEAIDYTDRTCIIVVEVDAESAMVQVGVVVDAVSEVLNIRASEIEDTPSFGTRLDTDYILGMAKNRRRRQDSAPHRSGAGRGELQPDPTSRLTGGFNATLESVAR